MWGRFKWYHKFLVMGDLRLPNNMDEHSIAQPCILRKSSAIGLPSCTSVQPTGCEKKRWSCLCLELAEVNVCYRSFMNCRNNNNNLSCCFSIQYNPTWYIPFDHFSPLHCNFPLCILHYHKIAGLVIVDKPLPNKVTLISISITALNTIIYLLHDD